MSFGTKLKIIRIEHKLDQAGMCERFHLSQAVYSRYENDLKIVDEYDPFVIAIAEAFNKNAKWLVASENKNNIEFENEISQLNSYYVNVPKDLLDVLIKILNQQSNKY